MLTHDLTAAVVTPVTTATEDVAQVDLADAGPLDWTAVGLFLAKCRDVLDVSVTITGAAADHATLGELGLLSGASFDPVPCRHPQGWHRPRSQTGDVGVIRNSGS